MTMTVTDDAHYMRRALELAVQGRGRTSPNPLVGAVVVREGEIVGEGFHPQVGMPHAEIYALDAAGDKTAGSTLYTTLEPCDHTGRTPPCTEKLIASGLKRIVVAHEDPNPLVAGRGVRRLRDAGIGVDVGVEEEAARRLNESYSKFITTKRPFLVLKTAMSLDGKIATAAGESQWITNAAARDYVHELRTQYDAVMVGFNTIVHDDPQLTCRIPGGRDPWKIVLDSQARTPTTAKIFHRSGTGLLRSNLLIVVTETAPKQRIRTLQEAGAEVLVCDADESNPDSSPQIDLRKLMVLLGKRNITSVLMESGGTLNAAALKAGIVDKVVFFIAPKIIGGHNAMTPVEGPDSDLLTDAVPVFNWTYRPVDGDLLVEGYLNP